MTMTTREAVEIVTQYGIQIDAPGLLEAVEAMDAANVAGELTERQSEAYLVFIDEMAEFVRSY